MQESCVDRAHSQLLHEVDAVYDRIKAVSTGGPASALLSYVVLGVFVYAMTITL